MRAIALNVSSAPEPIGPYSHMVRCGDMLYLSGQIALDPETANLNAPDVTTEARQVFRNIRAVLEETGAEINDVVKLTVYVTDLAIFDQVNAVMTEFLSPPYPARTTVQVAALPRDAKIEIDAVAIAK